MILRTSKYEDLPRFCKVINLNTFDYFDNLDVRLPDGLLVGYKLFSVDEVSLSPSQGIVFEKFEYDEVHPWIKIPFNCLNMEVGKHTYKLSFFKEDNVISTFFSYIIQNNDVVRPYIYMKDRYIGNEVQDPQYIEN